MRAYRTLASSLLATVIFGSGYLAYASDSQPQSLLLKVREGVISNNTVNDPQLHRALSAIGGNYSVEPWLQQSTIQALRKAYNSRQMTRSAASNNRVRSLERIVVVRFESNADPAVAASKLESQRGVEYAEPMPVHTLFGTPNDPLYDRQYHLERIRAFSAWDSLRTDGDPVVIAIVDTGIDPAHSDLTPVLWQNSGEVGNDSQGRDKRTNGVDDDNNGFVDDWRGWDFFGSAAGAAQDNNPSPGNAHGTHVAGTAGAAVNNAIGVAGVAPNVRLMAIKIGPDNSTSTQVGNGFEGVAYAAAMGAKIINCSWGSSNRSNAEQEVINTATDLGSLVVAAAGNDNVEQVFYPAGYDNVFAVAASTSFGTKASFSNYGSYVDITAPGQSIYATLPGNGYGNMSGTSMASPIVAGVAAMVAKQYPQLTPKQIAAQLVSTADWTFYQSNNAFLGKLGSGLVDALAAVSQKEMVAVELAGNTIYDENANGIAEAGEIVDITIQYQSMLGRMPEGVTAVLTPLNLSASSVIDGEKVLTPVDVQQLGNISSPFKVRIPANAPANFEARFSLRFMTGTRSVGVGFFSVVINPTWITVSGNNTSFTVNSVGNIGFNDFPNNLQGVGFTYKNGPSILFEGAFMAATGEQRISNSARSSGSLQDASFTTVSRIGHLSPAISSTTEVRTVFEDNAGATEAGIRVEQKVFQSNLDPYKDLAIIAWNITNKRNVRVDSLFAGLYCDWDISPSGQNDKADYDSENMYSYVRNMQSSSDDWVGISLVSDNIPNVFMIDNDGVTPANPGVYDGYTRLEKWQTLSSGLGRTASSVTDVSTVVGAGPISLEPNQSTMVAIAIFGGKNKADLDKAAEAAREFSKATGTGNGQKPVSPESSMIRNVWPNPSNGSGEVQISYSVDKAQYASVTIYDMRGQFIAKLAEGYHQAGVHTAKPLNTTSLATGTYIVRLNTAFGLRDVAMFSIAR